MSAGRPPELLAERLRVRAGAGGAVPLPLVTDKQALQIDRGRWAAVETGPELRWWKRAGLC